MGRTVTRKTSAERRAEIHTAVLHIVGEQGVSALSTAAIAQRVGVTTGALFRHFATLDDILVDTARLAVERLEETFPPADHPPVERIVRLAGHRIALLGADRGLAWFVRSEEAVLRLPEAGVKLLEGVVDRSRRYLLDALRDGAADGSVRADIPPEDLLLPVMGTIHAAIGSPGIHGASTRTTRRRVRRVQDTLEALLSPGLPTKNRFGRRQP